MAEKTYEEMVEESLESEKLTRDEKCLDLKTSVMGLRQELIGLWDKCHFTDAERNFEYFHTDLYTDNLLTLFNMEIQKMQKYHNENSELFNLLEKWKDLSTKWLALEQQSTTPNRYHNRGGQLLKEEKERNALSKRIPKIEEKLRQHARDFETRVGKQFFSWGETISAIIFQAKEKYDQDKKHRLNVHRLKRDNSVSPVPVGKGAIKKTPSLFPAKSKVPKTAPPKLQLNGRPLGPSRNSIERAKRLKKCRRRISQCNVFEKELQETPSSTRQ